MKQFTRSNSSLALTPRAKKTSARTHTWLTVIDPTNHRLLLQACDNCGVVKSENSVIRHCSAPSGQALLSGSLSLATQLAI